MVIMRSIRLDKLNLILFNSLCGFLIVIASFLMASDAAVAREEIEAIATMTEAQSSKAIDRGRLAYQANSSSNSKLSGFS